MEAESSPKKFSSSKKIFLISPFLLIVLLYISLTLSSNKSLNEQEILLSEFQKFTDLYSIYYSSSKEFDSRYDQFRKNLNFILEHNKQSADWVLGINKFSDLSGEEFKRLTSPKKFRSLSTLNVLEASDDSQSIPNSVNWVAAGVVTRVRTQYNCGSHWAFSAVGAVESAWKLAGNALEELSVQQVVDCSKTFGNVGCDGGLMGYAFNYIISNKGLTSEANYPYVSNESSGCNSTLANQTIASITSYANVTSNSSQALLQAISNQPVSIAVEADQSIWQFYAGGVVSRNCGTLLDHGALAVGYNLNTSPAYYLIKNSWGPEWGEDGYIRLAVIDGVGVCGVQMLPSYPIV